jgi:hypothetical protein
VNCELIAMRRCSTREQELRARQAMGLTNWKVSHIAGSRYHSTLLFSSQAYLCTFRMGTLLQFSLSMVRSIVGLLYVLFKQVEEKDNNLNYMKISSS